MSRFSQLMQRGQQKVRFKERQGKLLMTLSAEQHKAIARLLQHWLNENDERPQQKQKGPGKKS